jgi:hypothetical protein
VVVAARLAFVPEEVDLVEVLLHELKAETLVPALGEDVEGDLAANRKSE